MPGREKRGSNRRQGSGLLSVNIKPAWITARDDGRATDWSGPVGSTCRQTNVGSKDPDSSGQAGRRALLCLENVWRNAAGILCSLTH